jgi:Protein of unknown function (DUF4229)
VKDFLVYTVARLGLLVASFLVIGGIFRAFGSDNVLVILILAAVVSAVASYYLLQGPRARFAARVDSRASRVAQRFEESRAKEDGD